MGDSLRFAGKHAEAVKAYRAALAKFRYVPDIRTDIHAGIARCHLAMDEWDAAREPLYQAFLCAPDALRRNRAVTLLVTAFLKTRDLDSLYPLFPYLLRRDSQASRSIAFNLSALEAGDDLFADERYREALWIYRLVFPYEEVQLRTEAHLEHLKRLSEYEKRHMLDPRRLIRLMEWIGDAEAELKTLGEIDNYDQDLFYRVARGYMEALRYHEACEAFLHLHGVAGKERAEESLYLAFTCASRIDPPDRCFPIARRYMDRYPAGLYYDEVTLLAGQLHAHAKRWEEVIRHFSEVLRTRPNHQMAAECLFLLGYAHFMEEQFPQAIARFREVRERFPGWEQIDAAVYWTAMSRMFAAEFEEADKEFTLLIQSTQPSAYREDGLYRRAVCRYALARYEEADACLADYLKQVPEGSLRFEVHMLRGDVAGTVGRTDDAVACYQAALAAPDDLLNIEFYNHCAFQAGQILFDSQKFEAVREHFDAYLARNREGANIPLAVYWSGKALFTLGEQAGAARYYRDAVERFGGDRKAMGVDLILDEWVATTRRLASNETAAAWNDLVASWKRAAETSNHVSRLRYQRVLVHRPGNSHTVNLKLLHGIVQPENLPFASPAVMETMLDSARVQGLTPLAVQVAEAILADYPETDFALEARMFLARHALAQAQSETARKAKPWVDQAVSHLTLIRDAHATSPEAGEALLLLGAIHRDRNRFDEAQSCFEAVLGVKSWRNLWPEALHGLGLCFEKRKDWIKATAYYERIYVMYGKYLDWTAKAYLRRAECLLRAYQEKQARETLEELLGREELKPFPEYAQAVKLREKLEVR